MLNSLDGCITAIITPFGPDGNLDMDGLGEMADFQLRNGVGGIVVAGTTGEGPTLEHQEFLKALSLVLDHGRDRALSIANTGANNTRKALEATTQAWGLGARAALLVDPYYNCPSSLEIRREYYEPIARAASEMWLIPYVIPGRTGTQLAPEDISILAKAHPNIFAVKEATGSSENAAMIRSLCGHSFSILSGDDERTYSLMTNPNVKANGTISVMSNIAPRTVSDMVSAALRGDLATASSRATALKPLFELVTVKTEEQALGHSVTVKARNPVPVKTMAALLGMPSGGCRGPLGRMTKGGLDKVLMGLKTVWSHNPEILEPIEKAFGVSIADRLGSPASVVDLYYEGY
jgi:4-hydroxy-tetrahydrodipicolinate synthase